MSICDEAVYVLVGNGLVRPEATKMEAVQLFPTPGTKTDVRAFLVLTG